MTSMAMRCLFGNSHLPFAMPMRSKPPMPLGLCTARTTASTALGDRETGRAHRSGVLRRHRCKAACRRSEAGRKNALYGLAVLKVGRTFVDKGVDAFTDVFGLEDFGEQVSLDL